MEQPIKNNNHVAQKIMGKIKTGEVKIRPKLFFTLKTAIYFVLISLSFCLAVFLASFVAFAAGVNEMSYLLLILSLWALLATALAIFLAKKFSFFYKKPLAIGLIIFIVAIAAISALVLRTTLHNELWERSQKNNWPIISPLYRSGCGCQDDCGCGQGNNCPLNQLETK